MDFRTFERYAGMGGMVPVYRERLADMETPVSVAARFSGDDNFFLLESVEGGERFGRYSFIGVGTGTGEPGGLPSIGSHRVGHD